MIKGKYLLAFVAVTFFFCRDAFFSGRVLLPLGGDHVFSVYSAMSYFRHWMTQGEFPLWNPLVMCGHPFGINSETFMSLFFASAVLFEVDTAYNIVMLANILLNGVFLYLFLVRTGASPFAAWTGGLVWILTTVRELSAGFFFLPLCLLLADRYVRQRNRLNFLVLTAAITLYALNANPQHFLYGGLFIFSYMVYVFSRGRDLFRRVILMTPPFVIAGGLILFYVARLIELALASSRTQWDVIQMLSPFHYLLGIFPRLFESFSRPDLDFMVQRLFQAVFAQIPYLENVQRFMSFPYLGILPVVGFFLCIRLRKREPSFFAHFFLTVAIVVLVYLTLHPLFYLLIVQHVPFLNGMHNVSRALFIFQLCLSVLTAQAMELLLRRGSADVHVAGIRRGFVAFFVLLGSVFVAARAALFHFKDKVTDRITADLEATQTPSIFIESHVNFMERRVEDFFHFFGEMFSLVNPHFWGPVLVVVAFFLILHFNQRRKIPPRMLKFLLTVFVVVDVGLVHGFSLRSSHPSEIRPHEDIADFLKRDAGLYRVMLLEDKTQSFRSMFLSPESNQTYGIATPDGYEQLYLKRYVRFHRLLTKGKEDARLLLHPRHDFDEALADLINCKYILTSSANAVLDGRTGYEKIWEGPNYKIYRNADALERFFVVHGVHHAIDRDAAETYLKHYPHRLREEVLLEGGDTPPLESVAATGRDVIEVLRYEPDAIDVRAQLSTEGYLVMSEVFFPGWKAFVNGHETTMELADYAFRAIRLGEGEHTVSLVYDPHSLKVGNMISMIFLIALACIIVFFNRLGLAEAARGSDHA